MAKAATVNVPDDEADAPAAKVAAVGLPKMVRIILEDNENMPPTGQPFSLNGRAYILRPGEPANVPEGIINILNDALVKTPIVNPTTLQVVGWRDRLRFSYRVLPSE